MKAAHHILRFLLVLVAAYVVLVILAAAQGCQPSTEFRRAQCEVLSCPSPLTPVYRYNVRGQAACLCEYVPR